MNKDNELIEDQEEKNIKNSFEDVPPPPPSDAVDDTSLDLSDCGDIPPPPPSDAVDDTSLDLTDG